LPAAGLTVPEYLAHIHEAQQGLRKVRVSAEHPMAVARVLGISPTALVSVELAAAAPRLAALGGWAASAGVRKGGKRLDTRLFSQELALLLQSGIPLLEALQTLREKDVEPGRQAALGDVVAALREGQAFSAALARAPEDFDSLFVALVSASERSGQLATSLQDHAAYLTWSAALKSRLVASAVYPLMLLGVGAAVIVFLLLYVLPRFAGVFDGLGRDLPAASRALIDFGVFAAAHPLSFLAVVLAVPVAAVVVARLPSAQRRVAAWLWLLPGLGPRLRVVALARLYRSLALLLGAGVPMPAALALLGGVLSPPLRPALQRVKAKVEAGERFSNALQHETLATPVAQRMVRVGESSGELPLMLARAASFHDEEIARLSELVTRAVNPALMLIMGVLIGGIVVLMYLPIFTLMESVQ
jgi:general secretion pathway protein F